jgi:parvulin-like peptidyl-prolyl isomerase
MKKLFDAPWFQVTTLGLLIAVFLLIIFGPVIPSEKDRKIVIDDADVAQLIASWQSTWNRLPSKEELTGILQNHVREEVLYQEALKQGLDRTNAAVKRALITQMDMLAEGQGEKREISDEDILAYYNLRKDQFVSSPLLGFKQVYFGQDIDEAVLRQKRDEWNERKVSYEEAWAEGVTTMLSPIVEKRTSEQVDREFGEGFSNEITAMETGLWTGPVASSFGWHLIFLDAMIPSEPIPLTKVRGSIYDQLEYEEKNAAKEQFYTELIQQYDVTYKGLAKEIVNE